MKILFFGAGVLGSLYAARLHEAGHAVSILARGQRLEFLKSHGIILEHVFTGKCSVSRSDVVEKLAPEDNYDWIVVLVRRNQVDEVLSQVGAVLNNGSILVMVNNASGYQQWIEKVGRERLVVGFAGAGGTVEAGVVKYALAPSILQPTTLGELGGRNSHRLSHIVHAFRQAGFPATICHNMDAWQKTHVAWVSPLANAIYFADKSGLPLHKSFEALHLTVQAIREGFVALRRLGYPTTPARHKFWQIVPEPVLLAALRIWAKSRHFNTLILRHSLAARDEMRLVSAEYVKLCQRAGTSTSAIEQLHGFC